MQDIYCRNKALLVSDFVIDDQLVELWRSAQSMVRDRCGPDARLLFEAVLYFGRPSTLRVVADGASSDDLRRGLEAAVAVIPAERIVMTMTAQWTRESLGDSGDYATTVPEEALADSEALAAAERATRTICGPTARFEFD
ncbi:MAG TPA: hypothetical protein VFR90_17225 [Methylibium sp.]|uniref:hypothetical protein n=1 Tax=Methylibium sp. TaxID=2067992 RepID=UPI002DB702EE|nr:hypothetical protein [Methylibium sp.]HEU4460866.1 hypothetical protein [Methylibium sp.]